MLAQEKFRCDSRQEITGIVKQPIVGFAPRYIGVNYVGLNIDPNLHTPTG